jgi:hypothetical protein
MVGVMVGVDERVRGLVEMVVRAHVVLVRDLREQSDVLDVVPANIDVEEEQIAVFLLPLHKVSKLGFNVEEGLRESLPWCNAVYSEVDGSDSGFSNFVDKGFVQQVPVRGKVHEKSFFCSVPDHFEDKVFAKQGFPSHERNDTASQRVKPVHRTLGGFQVHAGQAFIGVIVVLEAVVTVYVAVPLCEKVAKHGSEFIGVNAGIKVWKRPSAKCANTVEGLIFRRLHPGCSSVINNC